MQNSNLNQAFNKPEPMSHLNVLQALVNMARESQTVLKAGASYFREDKTYSVRFDDGRGNEFVAPEYAVRGALAHATESPRSDLEGRIVLRALKAGVAQLEFARSLSDSVRLPTESKPLPSYMQKVK